VSVGAGCSGAPAFGAVCFEVGVFVFGVFVFVGVSVVGAGAFFAAAFFGGFASGLAGAAAADVRRGGSFAAATFAGSGARLVDATFREAVIARVRVEDFAAAGFGATLGVAFAGAAVAGSGSGLVGAAWAGARFVGAVANGVLVGAVFVEVAFAGAALAGAALAAAGVVGVALTGAVLTGAVLTGAVLAGGAFAGVAIAGGVFLGAALGRLAGVPVLDASGAVVSLAAAGSALVVREGGAVAGEILVDWDRFSAPSSPRSPCAAARNGPVETRARAVPFAGASGRACGAGGGVDPDAPAAGGWNLAVRVPESDFDLGRSPADSVTCGGMKRAAGGTVRRGATSGSRRAGELRSSSSTLPTLVGPCDVSHAPSTRASQRRGSRFARLPGDLYSRAAVVGRPSGRLRLVRSMAPHC
jgi:uncharacterized protein YjbI with pentapeptide repeats